MKTIRQQIHAMRRRWPQFSIGEETAGKAVWFGPLVGVERPYNLIVEYGLPVTPFSSEMFRQFPVVRVLSPQLRLRFDAAEEAPLPHVFFEEPDVTLSPLCLFDPAANEWTHNDLIAVTTIPWAADWLACYEGWLATGKWFGGGRHAARSEEVAS